MAKTKIRKQKNVELDSTYLLKMVIYVVLGSFWLKISLNNQNSQIPIPIGFLVGIVLAHNEKLQIDRKLEYAILLMAMFIGFWLPIGITIAL